jgi:hypothetical protein
MPMMDNLRAINSFLRTLIAVVVLGGAGTAGYYGYTTYNAKEIEARKKERELKDAQQALSDTKGRLQQAEAEVANKVAELKLKDAEIVKLNESIEKLETALTLLKVDHRVARFGAVDQTKDETTGEVSTLVEFVELNDEGQPIETPRQFRVRGDVVYVDGWVVKFDDRYIEQADLERGTSLLLFKRLFGSGQRPDDGYPLDAVGSAPKAYARGGRMTDFERKIWDDFWNIANDPQKAAALGIRAVHGDAPSMRVQKGKWYKVLLRSTGEMSVVPDDNPPGGRRPEA